MFVSSEFYSGDFDNIPEGALAFADSECNRLASEAARPLPGEFVAYLSDDETVAPERLGAASGWIRPDGRVFAETVDDITQGAVIHPPLLNESGGAIGIGEIVRTGTKDDGDQGGSNCYNWTSASVGQGYAGYAASTSQFAGKFFDYGCGAPSRIYCFGKNKTAFVEPRRIDARVAFISEQFFVGDLGRERADEICNQDAAAASLDGDYLALLPLGNETAASRFDPSKGPWTRSDGVPIAGTGEDAFDPPLLAPINLNAKGVAINGPVFIGSTGGVNGIADDACGDWTVADGDSATVGRSDDVGEIYNDTTGGCGVETRIYCFQE
jgi:hypothetical protein